MTDQTNPIPVKRRTLGRTIGLFFLVFAAGLAVAIWALTRTSLGQRLLPSSPAPIAIDPAKINQGPGLSDPGLVPPPLTAPGDLAGRLALLEGRLAQAEARGASGGAGGSATGASTNRVLLLMAVRRALETGRPLGGLEVELDQAMGAATPHLVSAVKASAQNPVTLASLKLEFEQIRPQLDGSGEKWWARISNSLSNLITVRSSTDQSGDPAVLAEEADIALHRGDVSRALELVQQLPNKALATDWLSKAQRYSQGMDALDKLEDEAFTTLVADESSALAPVMGPVIVPPLPLPAPVAPPIPGPGTPERLDQGSTRL